MPLTTAFEVLKYSPAAWDYPTKQFCELIPQIEEQFARECLGVERYEYFLSKLTPYPENAQEWDRQITYKEDDVVVKSGCLFVSVSDCNNSNPLSDSEMWEPFERFTDENVNLFWEKYLRRIFALKVYSASLVHTTWKGGASGITLSTGDNNGFRSGNKGEIFETKTQLLAEVDMIVNNMLFWLKANSETSGFPKIACEDEVCKVKNTRSRRWGF